MPKQKPELNKASNAKQRHAANTKQPQKQMSAKKQSSKPTANVKLLADKNDNRLMALFGASLFALLLLAVLFSGCMTLKAEKVCGLVGCIAVVIMSIFGAKKLKMRQNLLFYFITAYVVWALISTQYALSGKFALSEATKLIVAYAFFLLVVVLAPKKFKAMKSAAYAIAALTAVIGVLSVDAASAGTLSGSMFDALAKYTSYYNAESAAFNGSRIGSFITNSNVFGELMSLGVICSFWLTFNAKKWHERLVGALLIVINLYSDVLAMSLVALAVCVVACLAMALMQKRGGKLSCLLLMIEGAAITLAALLLSYTKLGTESALPMLCCLFGGVALFGVDSAVRMPLGKLLKKASNAVTYAILGAVVVLAAGAAYIVLNTGAPYELTEGDTLVKSVKLKTGEYEFSIETERPADTNVTMYAYSNAVTSIAKSARLFSGNAADEITVSVPEGTAFVSISIRAAEGTDTQKVTSIAYSGPTEGYIAPGYKYLPSFITNRLQSLAAAETPNQRAYLFKTSLALFGQHPIIGTGLGGYESGILSIQPFFLETKYAHNHYLQALCDLGVIGGLLYLGILVLSVRLLWIRRKDEKLSKFCPVFAALLIAMFGGAISDIIWSSGNYLPVAFTILGMENVLLGENTESKIRKKDPKNYVPYALVAVFLVFGVALSMNMSAAKSVESGASFASLEAAAKKDAFESNDYLYSYVVNAPSSDSDIVRRNALKYAGELSQKKSNTMGKGLAQFYFSLGKLDEGFKCLNDYVDRNRSKNEAWQAAFDVLQGSFDPVMDDGSVNLQMLEYIPEAVPQIIALAEKMEQVSKEQLDTLMLNDETVMWLTQVGYIAAEKIGGAEELLDVFTNLLYDSRYAPDFNENGMPDPMRESTSEEGVTYLYISLPLSELCEYSVDWCSEAGESLQSEVWTVEEKNAFGTRIEKAILSAGYLSVCKQESR